MNWTAGDALAIIVGLALFALVGSWLDRLARHVDQVDDSDDEA